MAAKQTGKQHGNRGRKRPGAAKHLVGKQWKPGQSGNPKGRAPKALSVTSTLKAMLEWPAPSTIVANYRQLFPQLPANPTCIEILTVRAVTKAMDIKTGDVMAKEIWERLDGKVPFPISGAGGPDSPIPIKFDFSGMSVKELDIFERLLGKCQSNEET